MSKKHPAIIPVLGLDNAGKSALMKRLKNGILDLPCFTVDFTSTPGPSVGFQPTQLTLKLNNYSCFRLFSKQVGVTYYDIGGGKNIRSIWKNYLAESHGCIFVVNGKESERFEEAVRELAGLLLAADGNNLRLKPILVLFNSIDGNTENYEKLLAMIHAKNFPLAIEADNDFVPEYPNSMLIRKVQIANFKTANKKVKKNQVGPDISDSVDPSIWEAVETHVRTILKFRHRIEVLIKCQLITQKVKKETEKAEKVVSAETDANHESTSIIKSAANE